MNPKRTVIRVLRTKNGAEHLLLLEQKPDDIQISSGVEDTTETLRVTPQDRAFLALAKCPSPRLVRRAGSHLYQKLRKHPPIREVIDALAAKQPEPGELGRPPQYPIYFKVDSPELESLPWEALCTGSGAFLTVDDKGTTSLWPIGRMPTSARFEEAFERPIGPVPRVTLVVAAADVSLQAQANEFDAIWNALLGTGAALQLMTSDEQLIKHALNVANATATGTRLTCELVASQAELLLNIDVFQPNLVHFFCHGSSDGVPQLELETRTDRMGGNEHGSILLDATGLLPLTRCDSIWLLTLNCCQGARAPGSVRSIAHNVAAAGLPAVLAMRESIRHEDATVFSQAFYKRLMSELGSLFGDQPAALQKGTTFQVEDAYWAWALRDGRKALTQAATDRIASSIPKLTVDPAGGCAEWTFPVLYLHRGGLRLIPRRAPRPLSGEEITELRTELELLQQLRLVWARGGSGTQADALEKVGSRMKEIEEKLQGEG